MFVSRLFAACLLWPCIGSAYTAWGYHAPFPTAVGPRAYPLAAVDLLGAVHCADVQAALGNTVTRRRRGGAACEKGRDLPGLLLALARC